MNIRLTLVLLSLAMGASAQGIVVNPDGTHSHVVNNGNMSIIVNSNGTHSTAFRNGNTSIIVNPNGTHSTAFHNGNTSIIVNPDGTHSTRFDSGTTANTRRDDSAEGDQDGAFPQASYRSAHAWERGPVVPEGVSVDLSQWKSGPVFWVYPGRYKWKPRK